MVLLWYSSDFSDFFLLRGTQVGMLVTEISNVNISVLHLRDFGIEYHGTKLDIGIDTLILGSWQS